AVVRAVQYLPENEEAKACDDVIEAAADHPRSISELAPELEGRPGNWRFTYVLIPDHADRAAMELGKLIALFTPRALDHDVASLIHDVLGNPFRPVTLDPLWRTSTVLALAEGVYADRAFDRLPILADALQDAGCDNEDILAH